MKSLGSWKQETTEEKTWSLSTTKSPSISPASTTAKPEKKLREFLNEQQEPFILEVYLLERGHSKKWSSNGKRTISLDLKKKKNVDLPFSKVLTTQHKKLAFHNQSSALIKDSNTRDEHVNVIVPHHQPLLLDIIAGKILSEKHFCLH